MNEIHRELKALQANLLRLNAQKYFNSDEFRYHLLENNWDDAIERQMRIKSRMSKTAKLEAFIGLLNLIITQWNSYSPESSNRNMAKNLFNKVINETIISYIMSNEEIKDYKKLVECLKKIALVKTDTISNIEKVIKEKNNIAVIHQNEINNENEIISNITYDYAIITALEEDEMEQILPLLEIVDQEGHIRRGYFKNNPEKKVVWASQLETGMIDASIIATEIIINYKPKYIIMPGVLGGKPNDTQIGDVIVATKVFTIDKGKLKGEDHLKEIEASIINNRKITDFKTHKIKIQDYIRDSHPTSKKPINIHFDPIASVRQVIDSEGFFVENFTPIERKTIGVEMESYGITRACELVGDGKTIPIIIKSVMDNTQDKTDGAKKYAAWTSAAFLDYVINNNLL